MAEQRAHWHQRLAPESPARLVFVDESGANTKMTRWYGRSAPVANGWWPPFLTDIIKPAPWWQALVCEAPGLPWLFEGAMNGEMFLAWIRQGLAPTLEENDVVIMDNLATHKVAGVSQAIEAAGARLLYLPPYSPDFNPIENLWSKVKGILRSAAPRNQNQLCNAARRAFKEISIADCRGFFLHAQYAT